MSFRRRLAEEGGFTLSEMLVVVVIMGVVLAALVQLFVAASKTQLDQANRFRAQQEARLALDSLRREIHCASGVSSASGTFPSSNIAITLGSYCTTGSGTVRWCTTGSGSRFQLVRTTGATCTGGVERADFLLTGDVFPALTPAGSCLRAKLSVSLPVDVSATTAGGLYTLQDDIVLRNTARGTC